MHGELWLVQIARNPSRLGGSSLVKRSNYSITADNEPQRWKTRFDRDNRMIGDLFETWNRFTKLIFVYTSSYSRERE